MRERRELPRQGMSIQAISELTGGDRKTIRKHAQAAGERLGMVHAMPSRVRENSFHILGDRTLKTEARMIPKSLYNNR